MEELSLGFDLISSGHKRANNETPENYNYTLDNHLPINGSNHANQVEIERVQDIVYLTMYSATCAVALFGNSIVVKVVFSKASMRNFTNLLLANMAISDILCALMFPLGLLMCWDKFIMAAGNYACITAKVIQLLSFQVSSVTMTVVAIDRFLLVYYPLVRRHRLIPVYYVMIFVWVLSLIIILGTSPSLAFHRYFVPGEAYIKCEVVLVFSGHTVSALEQRVRLVLANLAHFWIPLTVISVCYGSITWKVMKRNVGSMTTSQQELLLRTKWKTIKMLIAAVAVFFVCWFPFFILNLLDFFGNPGRGRPCNKSGMFFVAVWIAFTSCCYNPFVYWIYSKDFRGGLKDFWNAIETFLGWSSSRCRCLCRGRGTQAPEPTNNAVHETDASKPPSRSINRDSTKTSSLSSNCGHVNFEDIDYM